MRRYCRWKVGLDRRPGQPAVDTLPDSVAAGGEKGVGVVWIAINGPDGFRDAEPVPLLPPVGRAKEARDIPEKNGVWIGGAHCQREDLRDLTGVASTGSEDLGEEEDKDRDKDDPADDSPSNPVRRQAGPQPARRRRSLGPETRGRGPSFPALFSPFDSKPPGMFPSVETGGIVTISSKTVYETATRRGPRTPPWAAGAPSGPSSDRL